jgi:hypothetical protein
MIKGYKFPLYKLIRMVVNEIMINMDEMYLLDNILTREGGIINFIYII